MRRRTLVSGLAAGLGAAAAGWLPGAGPMAVLAQTPGRTYRLGHLTTAESSVVATREFTLPELARLGFAEGRTLVFDSRVGEADTLPGQMRELLATRPDAIIAVGLPAVAAAGAATRSVPIVTFGVDPTQIGLAASYARPGGNVTGVVILNTELEVKRLSILREALPERRRVAVLSSPTTELGEAALREGAAGLGAELQIVSVTAPSEYSAAFAAMRAAGAQALLIGAAPEFFRDGRQLAALALEARLPTVCQWAEMAHAGCLIGYGPSRAALRKRTASQIAQLFRGAAPADIAIERPTVFEFAVNQTVARALALRIADASLMAADELIE